MKKRKHPKRKKKTKMTFNLDNKKFRTAVCDEPTCRHENSIIKMFAVTYKGHVVEVTIHKDLYNARVDGGLPILEADFIDMVEFVESEIGRE